MTAIFLSGCLAMAQSDPGVRGGGAGAGGAIGGLSAGETTFFNVGQDAFEEVNDVKGTITGDKGLGPTFNMDSCAGCHAQPASGGTSPATNPQIAVATKAGADNVVPFFLSLHGPVREARFKYSDFPFNRTRDGGVHGLFSIKGRSDAPGCNLQQERFSQFQAQNIIFRIPTPTFGAGLIEAIPDSTIAALEDSRKPWGISGRANHSGNDGTITRFGWKAQNKSLVIFSGEAYNVEQGVSNEAFPDERVKSPGCNVNPTPEDTTNFGATSPEDVPSDVIRFSNFMRFLAPPAPVTSYGTVTAASITNGFAVFNSVGCAACHVQKLQTGNHSSPALANKTAFLYSDLLVHDMGEGLKDDVIQGGAGPREFRTAPLWGLGQRIFFLHDGRTKDLLEAIQDHRSSGSEANEVIERFGDLSRTQKQDLLNFLRSL